MMKIWAIIPVKSLRDGKSRLSNILSVEERAALTVRILKNTLDILSRMPVIDRAMVVSRDADVLKIAEVYGASAFSETNKQSLNSALTSAAHIAAAHDVDCILILPADLPFISSEDVALLLEEVLEEGVDSRGGRDGCRHRGISICSDHGRDGSNGLLICPHTGFKFQYGPNSFNHHLHEARSLGMSVRLVEAPGIMFDIDTEEDWIAYQAMQTNPV